MESQGREPPRDDQLEAAFRPRLPELLIHLRERAGWSQVELAERVGVDQSLISRIETGTTKRPQRRTLMRIADAFKEAGIQVEVSQLEDAADASVPVGAYGMDDRLVRIYERVSTYPPEVQDAFYDALYAAFRLMESAHSAGRYETR